eukprot:1143737-Pelagomonas_calceolata.AAC.1
MPPTLIRFVMGLMPFPSPPKFVMRLMLFSALTRPANAVHCSTPSCSPHLGTRPANAVHYCMPSCSPHLGIRRANAVH